jgi:hypothetical protein
MLATFPLWQNTQCCNGQCDDGIFLQSLAQEQGVVETLPGQVVGEELRQTGRMPLLALLSGFLQRVRDG